MPIRYAIAFQERMTIPDNKMEYYKDRAEMYVGEDVPSSHLGQLGLFMIFGLSLQIHVETWLCPNPVSQLLLDEPRCPLISMPGCFPSVTM